MWRLAAKYAVPAASVALVAALVFTAAYSYTKGRSVERTVQELKQHELVQKARAKQEALADELELAKTNRRIEYREVIREVERASDPSGCDTTVVPYSVLSAHGYSRD